MKIKCIACDALARPVYLSAAYSPHVVDIVLLERGLHNYPNKLRQQLQQFIDDTPNKYDAITLVYGLCGQATAGLIARKIPLVIPRAHDCITLFLGSRERYKAQFENYPGTYWYTQDYIERDQNAGGLSLGIGSATSDLEAEYQAYVEKYGQDNADYLMTVMGAWKKHYQRAVYIDLGITEKDDIKSKARTQAAERGWIFEEITGDLVLIRRLLQGSWALNSDPDFLVVPPDQAIHMTYDDQVFNCALLNAKKPL